MTFVLAFFVLAFFFCLFFWWIFVWLLGGGGGGGGFFFVEGFLKMNNALQHIFINGVVNVR